MSARRSIDGLADSQVGAVREVDIEVLSEAGVDFRVCGQALTGRNIESTAVQPEIQIDLWAMTTIINLQTRGYVHIGG